jgi:hypothetical protein
VFINYILFHAQLIFYNAERTFGGTIFCSQMSFPYYKILIGHEIKYIIYKLYGLSEKTDYNSQFFPNDSLALKIFVPWPMSKQNKRGICRRA